MERETSLSLIRDKLVFLSHTLLHTFRFCFSPLFLSVSLFRAPFSPLFFPSSIFFFFFSPLLSHKAVVITHKQTKENMALLADQPLSNVLAPQQPTRLRVATYNIWFDRATMADRLPRLVDELERIDADVLALQEVTRASLDFLLRSPWSSHYISSHRPDSLGRYGTVLFVRNSLAAGLEASLFSSRPFEVTLMGREMVTACLPGVRIYATHLESLGGREKVRRHQMREIEVEAAMVPEQAVIFMADTNFCSSSEHFGGDDGGSAREKWLDAWEQTAAERSTQTWPGFDAEHGFTFDSKLNTHVKSYRTRIDRIYYRAPMLGGPAIRASRFAVIGTQPTVPGSRHPSDHFGIACDLTLSPPRGCCIKTALE